MCVCGWGNVSIFIYIRSEQKDEDRKDKEKRNEEDEEKEMEKEKRKKMRKQNERTCMVIKIKCAYGPKNGRKGKIQRSMKKQWIKKWWRKKRGIIQRKYGYMSIKRMDTDIYSIGYMK